MSVWEVSRATVRRAVQTLVDEGLLVRQQGRGTFVLGRPLTHWLNGIAPFVSAFENLDNPPENRIVDFGWITGDDLPEQIKAQAPSALSYHRVFLSEGIPHALTWVCIPEKFATKIGRREVEERPIYEILAAKYGPILYKVENCITSEPAYDELAGILKVVPGEPLLIVERTTYTSSSVVVELTRLYLRADVYRLRMNVVDEPECFVGVNQKWGIERSLRGIGD